MLFSELALQGVRNFQQMHRIPLGKGFSLFVGGSGGGKSTVVDVVVHLLYPNATEPATSRFNSPAGGPCRASLLIEAKEGECYRLVQDLASGSIALTRQDPGGAGFVPVTSTAAEILQYLSSQLRLPQRDILEGIFVTRDSSLPSAMPRMPVAAAGVAGEALGVGRPPAGAVMGSAGAPRRRLPPSQHFPEGGGARFPGHQGMGADEDVLPDDPDELRSQIEILERDLGMAKEVDELQFQLDGLQTEIFEMDQKLKELTHARKHLEDLEKRVQQYAHLTELPGDFEKRVREFEHAKEKLDRDMGRLKDEQQKWEKKALQASPPPITRDRVFVLGLLLGIAALAAGVAGFFLFEGLRWVALLDLVGFGIAVVAAIRHIDRTQDSERSQGRLAMIEERREKLQQKFDIESTIVRKTMTDAGVENPAQLVEQYSRRNQLVRELEEARDHHERRKQDPEVTAAESRRDEVQKQVDTLEEKLSAAGGLMMDPREMERKIDRIKEKLHAIETGQPLPSEPADSFGESYDLGVGEPPGLAYGEIDLAGSPTAPAAALADPSRTLMKLAEDLFLMKRDQLEPMLAPRASQYVGGLTSQTYTQLGFAADGSIECLDARVGKPVPFSQLPPADQDLVYLGLKFTIVEGYSRQQPVPVLLDDPFKHIASNLHDILGRMLAGLGRQTQVVLLTDQQAWGQHATASFQL